MKPLRIIHTEASPGWGGQEIRIMEEMRWFRQHGHHLMLVAPPHSTLVERAKEEGFEISCLLFTKNRILREVFQFSAIIRRFKPDVVATHSSVDSWVGLVASRFHGITRRVRYRHVSTPVKGHFLNRWQYRTLCNLVFTTGECIRKPLIETFSLPSEKVVSAPTAIRPPTNMLQRQDARRALQSELKLGNDARFVGQVSVLRSWKGHFFLKEAFALLAENFPDLHLVFVGGGPQEPIWVETLAEDPLRDRIHLVGHKADPWPYFRALDLAVLASVGDEGIPQSLLQAMYAGIPVVGTNVGGIPEIVLDDVTGLIAKPSDPMSLADALKRLLDDLALQEKLSHKAYDLVSENFKWDALGQKIERLFSE